MGEFFQWTSRVGFCGLFLFELAGALQLLNIPLAFTWLGLLITSTIVFGTLEMLSMVLQKRWHVRIAWALWPLAFIAVSFDALGDIWFFYSRWTWYDQVAHFFGAGIVAIAVALVTDAIIKNQKKIWTGAHLFLVFCVTVSASVLYEIEEYLEDVARHTNRLGDGRDTANDLLMNVLGTLFVVVGLLAVRYLRERSALLIRARGRVSIQKVKALFPF